MIIANIIINLVEDKHLFTDEEQRALMERVRNVEGLLNGEHVRHGIATSPRASR